MSYYPNLRIGFTGAITFRDRDKGCSPGSVILLVLFELVSDILGTINFCLHTWDTSDVFLLFVWIHLVHLKNDEDLSDLECHVKMVDDSLALR